MHFKAIEAHMKQTGRLPVNVKVIVEGEEELGSPGDSYALAESVIGLFKTEVIQRRGPWRGLEPVEFATSEWVDWFYTRRLLEPIGYAPPAEYKARYYER